MSSANFAALIRVAARMSRATVSAPCASRRRAGRKRRGISRCDPTRPSGKTHRRSISCRPARRLSADVDMGHSRHAPAVLMRTPRIAEIEVVAPLRGDAFFGRRARPASRDRSARRRAAPGSSLVCATTASRGQCIESPSGVPASINRLPTLDSTHDARLTGSRLLTDSRLSTPDHRRHDRRCIGARIRVAARMPRAAVSAPCASRRRAGRKRRGISRCDPNRPFNRRARRER